MANDNLNKLEPLLKATGLLALALGICLGLADLMNWLRYPDREAFLAWAMYKEGGLPIDTPAAQAFVHRFPPPDNVDSRTITHVTKWRMRLEGGQALDAAFNYGQHDKSRTEYVATLEDVREWAAKSPYPWLSWVLALVGFIEVLGSEAIEWHRKRKSRASSDTR